MKGKNLFLMGLLGIALGLILVIFRNSLADGGVVLTTGIIFVIAGLLNMSIFLGSRDKQGRARMGAFGTAFGWVASAAAVILGLAMLIFSKAFTALIGFMFAVLILFAALFQMGLLLFGSKPHKLNNWFFVVPTILVGSAVYIFLRKPDAGGEHVVMWVTGCAFILFGAATLFEGLIIGRLNREARNAKTNDSKPSKEISVAQAEAAKPTYSLPEAEEPADKTK